MELNTEATLANLLLPTFSFQSLRSHEVGLSKSEGVDEGGWELHVGLVPVSFWARPTLICKQRETS